MMTRGLSLDQLYRDRILGFESVLKMERKQESATPDLLNCHLAAGKYPAGLV